MENHHNIDAHNKDDHSKKIKKYLIFKLLDNNYGVQLSDVREVIGLQNCVPVPSAPAYFLGLINLRGRVVSAIDLKKKMGVPFKTDQHNKRPAIIITEVGGISLGCLVDTIVEVLAIDEEKIDRSLQVDIHAQKEFIEGIARFNDRAMILLLDFKKTADVSDLIKMKTMAKAS